MLFVFFAYGASSVLICHVQSLADTLEDIVLAVNGLAPELPADRRKLVFLLV